MKSFDPYRNQHPDSDELDQLRAGLLNDEPARRQALLDHLSGCGNCRDSHGVADRVCASLDEQLESPAVAGALRARRRSALAGQGTAIPGRVPRLALIGATLSLLLGIGIFFALEGDAPTYRDAQWGPADHAPDPAAASPQLASQEAIPDVYSDLDFYLWLAHEREKNVNPGNRS